MRDRDVFLALVVVVATAVVLRRIDRMEYGLKRVLTDVLRRP